MMEILLILVAIIAIACLPAFLAVIGAILSGIFWTVAFVVVGIADLVGYTVDASGIKDHPGVLAGLILVLVFGVSLLQWLKQRKYEPTPEELEDRRLHRTSDCIAYGLVYMTGVGFVIYPTGRVIGCVILLMIYLGTV